MAEQLQQPGVQQQQQPETKGFEGGQQSQPQRYRPTGQQYQQGAQQPQTRGTQRPPSQQFQQQPMQQPQQQGGQFGQQQQGGQFGQQIRQRYEESVPSEVRLAVDDLEKVSTTAEWAKTKATERGLARVATVCDDIQDLAELQKKLIIRQSPVSHTIGQCSVQAIQEGLQELQQHMSEPEVQATIENAKQSLGTIQKGLSALQTLGTQQYGQQAGGQGMTQGVGMQSMGQSPSQSY
jgi:hypothetical protein